MYFYYMVAALGPKYQKYIWWKKYLTAFQMVSSGKFKEISLVQFSRGVESNSPPKANRPHAYECPTGQLIRN